MWSSGGARAREVRRVTARPPVGVRRLLINDDHLNEVLALIEGPAETPYEGGVFRVRVSLGREFPQEAPRARFETRLFHPNVSAETGEVCVDTLQRGWMPEMGLAHALTALRCLLIAPNADSALNAEAAALLRDKYDDYFARAKLLTDIHAKPTSCHQREEESRPGSVEEDGPCAKRPASGTRRRVLKRL